MDPSNPENEEAYSIEEIPSDRRACTRFQPDDQVRQTLLVIRKKEFPAKIVNFSATGCEVTTEIAVKTKVGDDLTLLSKLGLFMTRVVHVVNTPGGVNLGLKFTGELVPGKKNEVRSLDRVQATMPGGIYAKSSSPWGNVVMVFMVALIAVALGNSLVRDHLWTHLRAVCNYCISGTRHV